MTLFTEKKQTHGHGEQTCGCQGGRGGSGMDWEFGLVDANNYIYNGQAMRSYCTAQGTMSNLLGWNMMEDSMKKKKRMYIYI